MQLPFIHLGRMPGAGIPRVNWRHPLAEGLVAAYFPGAFPYVPIANLAYPGSGDLTAAGSTIVHELTQEGLWLALGGTAGTAWVSGIAPPQMKPQGRFSAFIRGRYNGNAGTNTPVGIFGVSFTGNASTSPFWSWAIMPNTATVSQRFGLGYASSSSTFLNTSINSSPALITNAMSSCGIVILGSPSISVDQQLYQNGVQYINNTTANIGAYGTTPNVIMGDTGGLARNCSFTLTAAYMWGAGIIRSTADMQYLDENPYALFLWPQDYIMAEIVKAIAPPGTPTPSNKAIFWSPLTVGLGGAAYAERWLRRRKIKMRRLRGE